MPGTIHTLMRYKAWANDITFRSVLDLPEGEATKPRQTNFGDMVRTLNHVFVVDDIFRHHLEGRPHGYAARNTDQTPDLAELWSRQRALDAWYVELAARLAPDQLAEPIAFTFVGGGAGRMSREEILLHVVNHGTYHRGFVNDMMYQVPRRPPANDLTVFLRDAA